MRTKRPNLMPAIVFSLALTTGIIFCCKISYAQDRDQLQTVYQKKIREESKQFFNWFKSHITGTISTGASKVLLKDVMRTYTNKYIAKRKGSSYISIYENLDTGPKARPSRCLGINSKYAFRLTKAKNGKDWLPQNIVEVTPDFDESELGVNISGANSVTFEKVKGFRHTVDLAFDGNPFAVSLIVENGVAGDPRSIDPWNVENLPGFLLHSISTDGEGQERIQLNFDYQVEDLKGKKIGVANCSVDFDLESVCYPAKSHQVMRNGDEETILDWSRTVKQNSEKEYEVKRFSRLKKTKKGTVTKFVESQGNTICYLNDPPESDFTLSAFGLPEPPGIEWKKPFPWYLLVAVPGIVCLGVFFFLRARGRRLRGS